MGLHSLNLCCSDVNYTTIHRMAWVCLSKTSPFGVLKSSISCQGVLRTNSIANKNSEVMLPPDSQKHIF